MGEFKRKSRSRREVMQTEARCIYCPGPVETLEHMPPVAMFRGRQRPGAMEYGACKSCNEGTRGSDAVAALLARVHPQNDPGGWQEKEIRKLIGAVRAHAPGVREELSLPGKFQPGRIKRPHSELYQKIVHVSADGPKVKAHLGVFGSKLAMALYREHVGVALPLDGAVWTEFTLNAGMTQEKLMARVEKLPIYATLQQGCKNVGEQFVYRYNCDTRTALAAVVQFHGGLWFTIVSSSDQKIVELFTRQEVQRLPTGSLVRPGGLLRLLTS
jgi:hypothetical protein